MKMAAEVI